MTQEETRRLLFENGFDPDLARAYSHYEPLVCALATKRMVGFIRGSWQDHETLWGCTSADRCEYVRLYRAALAIADAQEQGAGFEVRRSGAVPCPRPWRWSFMEYP